MTPEITLLQEIAKRNIMLRKFQYDDSKNIVTECSFTLQGSGKNVWRHLFFTGSASIDDITDWIKSEVPENNEKDLVMLRT